MTSKIEQIISEIEQYITEDCKPYPLSKSKIIVDRDHMESLISELQMKMPGEIKRFQKVLDNRNAILEDAQTKADAMVTDARENVEKMVSEHEIVQMAQENAEAIIQDAQYRAEQIVKAAQKEADELKSGSLAYAGESLNNLQILIGNTLNTVDAKLSSFKESMESYYNIIEDNKREIEALEAPHIVEQVDVMQQEEEAQYEDLSYE